MIDIAKYIAADAVLITGDRKKVDMANHNQTAGPGFTVLKDGKPIACGGIRTFGVGVAWFVMNEEAKKNHPLMIIRKAKKAMDEMQRENELCEVFAESENCDKWLEELGFHKNVNIFVR